MQGFNMGRYHPPASLDRALADKATGGFNRQKNGSSTQSTGPPTIRFEMPFAIWCTSCKPEAIIGQGVRFNAQKSKVGTYYSTPIWAFRMRHGACGSTIEIRTDPQAGDYVVHEGARRRNYGDAEQRPQMTLLGDVVTEGDRAKRAADPFASLEGREEQKEKARKEGWWVEKIQEQSNRDWDDVWSANRKLRQSFRVKRKELEAKEQDREAIAARLGLHIDVLDEIEEDGQRAALMRFGESEASTDRKLVVSAARPLFAEEHPEGDRPQATSGTKAERKAEKSRKLLTQSIKGNTRAGIDPFLNGSTHQTIKQPLIQGVKRKRDNAEQDVPLSVTAKGEVMHPPTVADTTRSTPLITYSSESSEND